MSKVPARSVMSADELRARLRRKFPPDQYAMLYEVRDAAGFAASRSADVVMIGLWPSRGCLIEGMEIKVSRTDWLRELKKPQKAEAFVPYCDHWWIVTGDAGIVKESELPPTWGLMVASGRGLGVVREAPKLEPKALDRTLLAAMLKRATATAIDQPEIEAAIAARVKAEKERFAADAAFARDRAQQKVEALERAIKEFEERSGVEIKAYMGGRIGDAVKAVMSGEHRQKLRELGRLRERVASLNDWMSENLPELTDAEVL